MEWGKWLWYSNLGDENHVRDCVALSVIGDSTFRGSAFAVTGWAKSGSLIRYRALELITTLFIGLGHLLAAQVIGPPAQVGSKPSSVAAPVQAGSKPTSAAAPAQAGSKPTSAAAPRKRAPNRLRQPRPCKRAPNRLRQPRLHKRAPDPRRQLRPCLRAPRMEIAPYRGRSF